jgi:M6 family metalloprotease-like protein
MNSKKTISYITFFIVFLLSIINVNDATAVTANPNPVKFEQPDGSLVTIVLKGDEFIHWAETTDHFTLLSNKNGAYEYAIIDKTGKLGFSGIQAHDISNRSQSETVFLSSMRKGLFFSRSQIGEMKDALRSARAPYAPLTGGFPHTGIRSRLTILANFSNTSTTYTQSNFDNMMNQVNYNGTGSFKDYYLEVSYGQLTVNTTISIWVTLPHNHDYYGPDAMWGQFALDAVTAANNQTSVNFAQFDNDADGVVDGVCIIHQGRGQEESGNTNDIWSHSWELSSAGFSNAQCTFDGVRVDSYTAQPEKGSSSSISTIGVMCHEFGHNMGAPDFYDTDYETGGQYDGTGAWDIMADGSWNGNSGDRPAHHNAYTKAYVYGWTTPVVLTTAQNKTLRKAETYGDVVRYNTTTSNEYFLCENRQLSGFDDAMPGHGLIIFHVDGSYIAAHSDANDINAGSHQGLYPVCANSSGNPPSSYGNINGGGCPFPGTGNKTSFSDATTPNSHSWAGSNTNYPLVNITENTSTKEITFCFINCSSPDDPTNFTATAASTSQINLTWGHNPSNSNVMVVYSPTNTFGTPVNGTSYIAGSTISGGGTVLYNGAALSYNHTGLSTSTTYYYKAFSVLTGAAYSTGVLANATTFCGTFTLPFSESFSNTTIPNCWTQVDNQGGGQIWLFGAITTQSPNPVLTGNYAFLNSDTYGSGFTQNADLITPTLDLTGFSGVTLHFNHYFLSYSGSSGTVSYSINNGTSWSQIQQFTSTSATNPAVFSQVIAAVANQPQVRFKWNYTGTYGYSWSVDDVSITGTSSTLTVAPPNQNVTAPAGTTPFTVTTSSAWTASSNAAWCTVTPSGSGNGTITATYTVNTGAASRIANITVTVAGLTPVVVTVSQAGTSPTLSVTPSNQNVTAPAGNTSFTVTSNSGWISSSNQSWCTVTPSGTGNGSIVATYTENTTLVQRVASITVTVAGLTPVVVTVTQAAPAATLAVTPPNQDVTDVAGNTSFNVTSNSSWSVSCNQTWCTVTPSGTGNSIITATYTANTLPSVRVANITVTVAGLTPVVVTVTQSGAAATLAVTPPNQNVSSPAGNTSFTVTTGSAWTSVSNQSWCTVTPSGTGNGIITATYSQNTSLSARVANITVTVTGLTPVVVTVSQAGVSSTLLVTPPNQEVTYAAGNASYTVTSNSAWTVMSDQSWCSVAPSGTGNGIITASYTQNSLFTSRTANITVTVTGLTPLIVTLTQAGQVPALEVTPPSQNVSYPAGTATFSVTSNTSWNAASDQSWCTVNHSGTGNGTITANYSENVLLAPRVAIITVTATGTTPVIVTVIQEAAMPTLSVLPPNQDVTTTTGATTFIVASNSDWTVSSDQTWCTVFPSGTGNGSITAGFTENLNISQRIAHIAVSVAGLTPVIVTVTQSGAAPALSVTPANQDGSEFAGSVEYTVTSNTDWTATSDSAWCLVTAGGSGNGTIVANYAVNPYHSQRVATITVSVAGLGAQTATLTQAHSTLSVEEHNANGFRLFPNPAKGLFSLAVDKSKYPYMEVSVIDLAGTTLLSRVCEGESEYHFDLVTAPQGCYFVKIETANMVIIRKLVIIKAE